jgi:lipopolysaccharide heptosyltransferase I
LVVGNEELELGPAPRVALVKLGALGDMVYTFPLVSALKAHRPDARVTWIVEARLADVPRLHPDVDEVVTVDTRSWRTALRRGQWGLAWSGVRGYSRAVAGRFDVAIDAQGLLKSGVAARLTRAAIRVGFASSDCRERGNTYWMTHHAAPVGPVHALVKNRGLLAALGIPCGDTGFEVRIPESDQAWARAWTDAHAGGSAADWTTLHPGAGHPGKRWPLDRWLAVAERLAGAGRRVAMVAGPEDRITVSEAVKAMSRPVATAMPPTVGSLAALLQRAEVVIAGDTGPLHLAAALGARTIAVYGPSDPVTAAPVGVGHAVIKHSCACGWVPGPTFNRRCSAGFACMQMIQIDEVVQAVGAL